MARHFAPTKKKKITLPTLQIPTLRLDSLPRLFPRRKKAAGRRKFDRPLSVADMALVLVAALLFIAAILFRMPSWLELAILAVAALLALLPSILGVLQSILSRKLPDEDLLMLIGVISAFCIGEWIGGSIAAILYRLAQILEAYALARGEAALDVLRDQLPDKARILIGDKPQEVMPETVDVGQTLYLDNGDMLALDGIILTGVTEMDQSVLTGNSNTRRCGVGDAVFSGSVNRGGPITVQVTKTFGESAAASLLRDVQDASRYETDPERLTNQIARWCGPVLGGLALLIALVPSLITGDWLRWLRCAVIFLLLASPSAFVISIPLACFGAEVSAALQGILSKGHDCFEVLSRVKTMVFGKTGTITEGRFEITGIYENGVRQEDLLAVAAAAESYSHHPIANLLKLAAGWTPEAAEGVMEVEEIPGRGVSAFIEGRHVYVGNAALLQDHGIPYKVPSRAGSAIHVAVGNRYWGHILINDRTREGAFDALESLRSQGVKQLVMLTGDVLSASRPLASSLGFDLMRTELSPEGKVSAISYLIDGKGNRTSVGFVGDGINDIPMLERADVGIAIDALRAWNEADVADILLLDNDIAQLPQAMQISRSLRLILWEIIGILAGIKLLLLFLALLGLISIPAAAAISTLSSALALLNSLRAFALK